jgi:hypothetical protein
MRDSMRVTSWLAAYLRTLLGFAEMLKPIKRIFVPKHLALQPLEPAVTPPAVAATAAAATTTSKPNALFDALPQPEMEEKNSDSIWAAFDSVHQLDIERE